MASSKKDRASMREGPLAALFRATEEPAGAPPSRVAAEQARAAEGASGATPATSPGVAPVADPTAAADGLRTPGADAGLPPADRAVPRTGAADRVAGGRSLRVDGQAPHEGAGSTGRVAADAAATPRRAGVDPGSVRVEPPAPSTPAGRGYPHPGLGAEPPPPEPEAVVASPAERLRSAFASELDARGEADRPAPAVVAPREAPAPTVARSSYGDPFARQPVSPPDWGSAKAVGQPVLRVVGVGGAGVNAINRMVEAEVGGVEFIAVNTDAQSLQQSTADITLHIGAALTRGLGAGANPDLGRASAMEDYDKIKALLKGADMVFIAAGSGGGTGTGAAPVVARIAKELGALTVGIITKPFGFEGTRRMAAAEAGVVALGEEVDTLIVVPNNRLLSVLDRKTSMVDAFRVADDVLRQGVQGVSDLVTLPGLINLDFADVRTIMSEAGTALLGIGMGVGEDRAVDAAKRAVESPLLETSMEGARKILLSITSGEDLSLWEVNEAAKTVAAAAHPDANIIFGAMVDDKLEDQVWITVVATGFGPQDLRRSAEAKRMEEPRGEPRVARRAPAAAPDPIRASRGGAQPPERRTRLGVDALDVPEFVPRGQ